MPHLLGSQARSSNQEQPVYLAWCFWDSGTTPVASKVLVPSSQHTRECRELFMYRLWAEYQFEAVADTIMFWAVRSICLLHVF